MPSGFQAFGNAEGFVGSAFAGNPGTVTSATIVAWYEADDPTITLVSGKVSNWPNKTSPGTGDAAQATAGNRPVFVASDADFGNKPSVDGSGAATLWLRGTGLANIAQPFTVFCIGTLPGSGNILSDGLNTDNSLLANHGGKWAYYATGGYADSTVSATGPNVAAFIVNGASSKAYVGKNTADSLSDPGAADFGTAVTLFNDGSHIFGGGKIACWAIYQGSVSESDVRSILLKYANLKYGLPIGP